MTYSLKISPISSFEISDAVYENRGLSGSRTGENEKWTVYREYRLSLTVVETVIQLIEQRPLGADESFFCFHICDAHITSEKTGAKAEYPDFHMIVQIYYTTAEVLCQGSTEELLKFQ